MDWLFLWPVWKPYAVCKYVFSGLTVVLKLPFEHGYFVSLIVPKDKGITFFNCLLSHDIKKHCKIHLGFFLYVARNTDELEELYPVSSIFNKIALQTWWGLKLPHFIMLLSLLTPFYIKDGTGTCKVQTLSPYILYTFHSADGFSAPEA